MKCVVVTPERTVVDKDVEFVVVPLYDGEYGVALNHTPLVGRLGAGELRLTCNRSEIERWYVEGGFVEVVDNVVSLLTNRAEPLENLDRNQCQNELDEALRAPSNSPELAEIKDESVSIARAKLRVAEKARAIKK